MILDNLYQTFFDSYLLIFLFLFTLLHLLITKIIKPLTKLKEGVSYDLEYALNRERSIISEYTFFVLFFYVFAIPISALSNPHYWTYVSIATVLMSILFFSDIYFIEKKSRANEGLVAYLIIPLFYIPALVISAILYYL